MKSIVPSKFYWNIKEKLMIWLFLIKKNIYNFKQVNNNYHEKSLNILILKKSSKKIIILFISCIFTLYLDKLFHEQFSVCYFDRSVVMNILLASIGFAGIILGLNCTVISSIYTAKYANSLECLSLAFRNNIITNKFINFLIDYIIYNLMIITSIIKNCEIGTVTFSLLISYTVVIIISYYFIGDRTYQLANIYRLSDDYTSIIRRIITKDLHKIYFFKDRNFQTSFQRMCSQAIGMLNNIQYYCRNLKEENAPAMISFMKENLLIMEAYWSKKSLIPLDSLWFKKVEKYQKWHLANYDEQNIAIKAGIPLMREQEVDYEWFEKSLMDINRSAITHLCEKKDYLSLYYYLESFIKICKSSIDYKEATFFITEIKDISERIKRTYNNTQETKNEETLKGLIDLVLIVYLQLLKEIIKYCHNIDIKDIINKTIHELDKENGIDYSIYLRGSKYFSFYKKIGLFTRICG